MVAVEEYSVDVVGSMQQIDAAQWDGLRQDDQPFTSHAFLSALETHQCVSATAGWSPAHLVARLSSGEPVAAMSLYLKEHSWGEFVFDFTWAQAYARSGLDYYPKLLCMCPFTPVTGRRLLASPDHPHAVAALLRYAKTMTGKTGASSLHILYPREEELDALCQESLLIRQDIRFMWTNRRYQSFDDFLEEFNAGKRKKIRRERRRVAEQNIQVSTVTAASLTIEEWRVVYELCAATFYQRGHAPYLTLDFFLTLARLMGSRLLVNLARIDSQIVGAAILLRDDKTLYGRYWGGIGGLDCLHFETCYYRGIEYCIEHQLEFFDPGTQGEHKLRRGFAPSPTWSAHWIADRRFRRAITEYLAAEREHVTSYMAELQRHLPFKNGS